MDEDHDEVLDSTQGTDLSNTGIIVGIKMEHQDSCLRSWMTSHVESCPDNASRSTEICTKSPGC